jgi:hypothetical protein
LAFLEFSTFPQKLKRLKIKSKIKIMKIKEALLKHKDGATFGLNFKPKSFKSGFAVSITNNRILLWTEKTEKELKREVEKLKSLAKELRLKRYYFGWWTIDKVGWLDISLVLKDKDLALGLAKIFRQKAVYNFSTGKCIYL